MLRFTFQTQTAPAALAGRPASSASACVPLGWGSTAAPSVLTSCQSGTPLRPKIHTHTAFVEDSLLHGLGYREYDSY